MDISKLLKKADYEYEMDDDDDFNITINYEDEDRSQLVYIDGEMEEFEGHEIINVWSIACKDVSGLSPKMFKKLLQYNASRMFGAWEISDDDALVYAIKVPAEDLSPELLGDIIDQVASIADDYEEKTSADDEL